MDTVGLKKYCDAALAAGAEDAVVINSQSVVTAPWVRWKCRFGCSGYGRSYCCPPETPNHEETRQVLDSYNRIILTHLVLPAEEDKNRWQEIKQFTEALVKLEGDIFKDGFYKALALHAGPCLLCMECGKLKDEPCKFGRQARPSLEACGIDVYQTARNAGLPIIPLREKTETQNIYCLLLVD